MKISEVRFFVLDKKLKKSDNLEFFAPVAQLDRVLGYEPRG